MHVCTLVCTCLCARVYAYTCVCMCMCLSVCIHRCLFLGHGLSVTVHWAPCQARHRLHFLLSRAVLWAPPLCGEAAGLGQGASSRPRWLFHGQEWDPGPCDHQASRPPARFALVDWARTRHATWLPSARGPDCAPCPFSPGRRGWAMRFSTTETWPPFLKARPSTTSTART